MTQLVRRTFSLILQFEPIIQFLMVVFSAMNVFSPIKHSRPTVALAEKQVNIRSRMTKKTGLETE